MSGSPVDPLTARRKRLQFRAWHRGTQEADLIFGQFIEARLNDLTEHEIAWFERLFEEPEQDVLAWVTGKVQLPVHYDTDLMRDLQKLDYLSVKK